MPKVLCIQDDNGKIITTEYTEHAESQSITSDLYLPNSYVDQFKNGVKNRYKVTSLLVSFIAYSH